MLTDRHTPAPSWEDPLSMLYACHGKVERFCAQLLRLPDYLAQHGYDDAVRGSVRQIRTYFTQAAPLHHDDEECDFFPALLQYAPQARDTVAELERQHNSLSAAWAALSAELAALENGVSGSLKPQTAQDFSDAYRRHIALEEPLFELGRQVLPAARLAQMGQVMAARRQRTS